MPQDWQENFVIIRNLSPATACLVDIRLIEAAVHGDVVVSNAELKKVEATVSAMMQIPS